MYKYSIVIPIFNEKDNLFILQSQIEESMRLIHNQYEVILVDDGSDDGSDQLIREICQKNERFHGIFFNKNYGQTAAFEAGFKYAKGEIIITMDGDLQYNPDDILLLLGNLNGYDMVCGYRKIRNDSLNKRISSIIANKIRNLLSNENIRDVGCSLKVFKKDSLHKVKLFEGMHRFFPTLLKMEGCTVIEIPVNHYPRQYGKSKYNIRNRIFKSFFDLLAVKWMKKRYLNYSITKIS